MENLFIRDGQCVDHSKQKDRIGIGQSGIQHICIGSKQMQKCRHTGNAQHHHENSMNQAEKHTDGSGAACGIFLFGSKEKGGCGIDADAKSYGNGGHQVLNGINQGKGSHCIFIELGYKVAVHNVIKRIYCHRCHHRKGHRKNQRQYFPFFHKRLFHIKKSLLF